MKLYSDPKQDVLEYENAHLQEIILRNWNQITEIHRENKKRRIEQLFQSAVASMINDSGRSRRADRMFFDVMNHQETNRFLKQAHPKIYRRIERYIQAARKEFSKLVRRQERLSLARLLKRVGLDPEGPYPKNLVEKYGRRFH